MMPQQGHNVAWLALRLPTLVWLCPGWDVFQGQVAGDDDHGSERTMHRPSGVAADTRIPSRPGRRRVSGPGCGSWARTLPVDGGGS